jgi:hypothetical protein
MIKVGINLIDSGKSFLSFKKSRGKIKLLPIFIPFLKAIIMLPQKVRTNLMIHNSLNSLLPIMNRQANHNLAITFLIVMNHTGGSDGILSELIR